MCKLISPWDHLLLRSEHGNPPLPQVPRVVLDYLSLVERARSFLCDQLEPRTAKKSKQSNEMDSENRKGDKQILFVYSFYKMLLLSDDEYNVNGRIVINNFSVA